MFSKKAAALRTRGCLSSGNSLSAAKANNQREPTRGFTTFPSAVGNFPTDAAVWLWIRFSCCGLSDGSLMLKSLAAASESRKAFEFESGPF